ncbi:MAG: NAD(P)-dependent dehydrogenase (short-subunit alcohol dehydrogenase family) [Hyphomicrobiaceae bacterium]|jgi:NAD(P)-dependent dehydrogenase (short-subunit alcohol dehydrogenase family)
MEKWTFASIPEQAGRRCIVTGANTGIGYEAAKALALKGADVTLACRNPDKGADALTRLHAENPTGSASFQALDLADLASVEAFAESFGAANDQLDLLILNAGVMVPPLTKTAQDFELQFGVNHLAHFALVGRLLSLLQKTEGARVVVLSSTAANFGAMDFDDLNWETRRYNAWPAYGQSKLANLLFTLELQRRLSVSGSKLAVTAAHPGWTATDLQRTSPTASFFNRFLAMDPPQGALPTLRAATDLGAASGDYYGPNGIGQMRGYPVRVDVPKHANSKEDAAKLWEVSEELTGVGYEF